MQTSTFVLKLIVDIMWYEAMWFAIKKGFFNIKSLQVALRVMIQLNIFFIVAASDIQTFVNVYFMTLWYFVIFPDRIVNELMEQKVDGPVA